MSTRESGGGPPANGAALEFERLAATLDRISDGVVTLDRDWRVTYVNQRGAEMLNRKRRDLLGRVVWDEFPQAVGEPYHDVYRRAMENGAPVVFEDYYAPWDRWFENHVYPSAEGLTILFRDVSGPREAQERLKESHARLQEAQEIAHFGHWQWEPAKNEVSWSNELFRIYGLDPDAWEATFEGYIERVHPDDRARVADQIEAALESREPFGFEERIVRPDGEVRLLRSEGRVVAGPDGGVARMVGVCHDLTEWRRAQQELEHLDQLHGAILESAGEGICVLDLNGKLTFVNPAAARMFGYEPGELLGLPAHETLAHTRPDGRPYPIEECPITVTVAEGTVQRCDDDVFWRKDGSSFWVDYTSTPVCEGDETVGVVVTFSDITDRRRAEEELIRYSERLAALRASAAGEAAVAGEGVAEQREDAAEAVVERAVALAREQLGMELAFLGEFSEDAQVLRVVDGDASSFNVSEGFSLPLEETYCQRLVAGKLPNVVPDARNDGRVMDLWITGHAELGAYVGVPIHTASGRIWGTLCCVSHQTQPDIDERDIGFLRTFGEIIAHQLAFEELASTKRRLETEATTAVALLSALETRDHYTGSHSEVVVDLAKGVAREMRLSESEITDVELTALLHDIGKVGIPDAILQKGGMLDELEWKIMREHPAIGERMICQISQLAHLGRAIRAEHERWDGSGYPDGLAGEEIPLPSRITLVCDAYHAMTSDRPYRSAMSHSDALRELEAGAGTQFDPRVVRALLAALGQETPG